MSFILSLTPSSVPYCFNVTLLGNTVGHFTPLSVPVSFSLSLSLSCTRLFAHFLWYISVFLRWWILGKYSKLHTEGFHYWCFQCFGCEHESEIFIGYCSQLIVRGATLNNSPFFPSLMSLVSSLSSVIPPVLPKDSQEAGNRSGVITGREGRKEGRIEREIERGRRKQCVIIVQKQGAE